MTFLHELAVRLTTAMAAGRTPDPESYLEQQEGEEVLGFVSDPQLLALIALRDDQDAELMLRRRKSLWLAGPTRAINQYLQLELQKGFANWEDVPLGIRRKGDGFVAVKSKRKGLSSLRNIVFMVSSNEPAPMIPAHAARNSR
jgi:hypothetical protein